MDKVFHNEKRTRYYGLRVGDFVRLVMTGTSGPYVACEGRVVELGCMDNNAAYVKNQKGEIQKVVAEWCTIIRYVEEWFPGKQGGTIITLDPVGYPPMSQESLEFYGGYVIAESVPPPFINILCAAPALLHAVEMLETLDREGQVNLWSDKRSTYNKALRIVRHGYDPSNT